MPESRPPLQSHDGHALEACAAGYGRATTVVPNGPYYLDDLVALTAQPAVAYDLRNRGASAPIADAAALERGVRNDVDDLEAVRDQLGLPAMTLVAHSYVAEVAVLYAVAYPTRVERLVLMGPSGHLLGHSAPPPPDAAALAVFQRLGALRQSPPDGDEEARCRAFWHVLAPLYVVDPRHAPRIAAWGRCALANERAFLRYWTTSVEPSLAAQRLSDGELARVTCPVLVIHGTRDRSAPLAAGEAWASRLPRATFLPVADAAHAPWIEAPETVGPALQRFIAQPAA